MADSCNVSISNFSDFVTNETDGKEVSGRICLRCWLALVGANFDMHEQGRFYKVI